MTDIAERFARDTADHQMTTLHNDGLYRHLRFKAPATGMYWFDLITVPGTLIFQGDGESFVFSRLTDMFEFFRSAWHDQPNFQYWAEKLTGNRDSVMKYDQELLVACVEDALTEYYAPGPVPAELRGSVRAEVLDEMCGDETYDRKLVDEFEWYADEKARYAHPRKTPDFHFGQSYEWKCRDCDWWYRWACHAIVWGISRYDERPDTRVSVTAADTLTTTAGAVPTTTIVHDRPVVDVHLPEGEKS